MASLIRLAIALLLALFGLVGYCSNTMENPLKGEDQRFMLTTKQEVALGIQTTPELVAQYGGLYQDPILQEYVDKVGLTVVNKSAASQANYPFDFHLLRDAKTINAFALPGGQVLLTVGLLSQLKSEAQLAAVLAHEVGHVVARHGAKHLAKQPFGQNLVTAMGVVASNNRDREQNATVLAQAVNELIGLQYGQDDELASDRLGLQFMTEAGYDPRSILELMTLLGATRTGGAPPEFFSTHPNPDNRLEKLQALIQQQFPHGIPGNLRQGREEFAQIVLPRVRAIR